MKKIPLYNDSDIGYMDEDFLQSEKNQVSEIVIEKNEKELSEDEK